MKIFDENFKEIFFSQLISITGGLIAGTLISIYTNRLFLLPGMLVLFPGFLETRGSISGSFSARLSSGLFLGIIKPDKMNTPIVKANIFSSFILAMGVCLALGVVAFFFNAIFSGIVTPMIILIPLIAGVISNIFEITITLFLTFYFFKKGHDPNNIMGPFISSLGDITSVLALLFAMVIV